MRMRVIVQTQTRGAVIQPEIYGHFAEHLGGCVYGGLYVGEGSPIPNVNGMRSDVVEALRRIRVPVLRWPGGCFAEDYHWRDGIGNPAARRRIVNAFWGGVVEDNSFGTHEFMELCRQVGCLPYIAMNVGTGTVQEMQDWVEYMTCGGDSTLARLRRENGRDAPWKVPFIGIGNENWGCGGTMRAEYYADEYRRYQTYVRSFDGNRLVKIACGPGTSVENPSYDWTETMMRAAGRHMRGLSIHYYTVPSGNWSKKGSATAFDEAEYYRTLHIASSVETILDGHEAIMDRYDPERNVGIYFDEWGAWYDVEPGTNPGFLYQQNTMRDALIAAVSLNVFNRHAARVRMANIAQLVNVLQAPILTNGADMVLTPTYHVFDLFQRHMGATLLESSVCAEMIGTPAGQLARIGCSASASDDGSVFVTVTNAHASEAQTVALRLDGGAYRCADARVLAGCIQARNTFDNPEAVGIRALDGVSTRTDALGTEASVPLPACSVAAIRFERV